MSDIFVGSTAALNAALTSAHDGDTILLQAGTYSGMVADNLSFAHGITITSADPSHQASLTSFVMNNDNGITVSNVDMSVVGPGYFMFGVVGSNNINFDHVSMHGSMDGNPTNDVEGLAFQNSTHISVTNSEFQQLERGLAISQNSSDITIANNTFHDLEVTGLVMAQVSNVHISGNAFSNFFPTGGDHPDAIQFETAGTTVASHDISITNNAIYLGTGQPTQGIFFRDQLGNLPYQNVTISNNLIDGTGYGGIAVGGVNGLTVANNTLITLSNGYTTPLQIDSSNNLTLTNNQATSIAYANDGNTNITASANVGNTAATDGGLSALHDWLVAHPGSATQLGALVSDLDGVGSLVAPISVPSALPAFPLAGLNLEHGYFKFALGDFF